MRIENYLITLPVVQKYCKRYAFPLILYSEKGIPEKYFDAWVMRPDTSIYDLFWYYVGVKGCTAATFVSIIDDIWRKHKRDFWTELPEKAQYGCRCADYWDKFIRDNLLEWMEAPRRFTHCKA